VAPVPVADILLVVAAGATLGFDIQTIIGGMLVGEAELGCRSRQRVWYDETYYGYQPRER